MDMPKIRCPKTGRALTNRYMESATFRSSAVFFSRLTVHSTTQCMSGSPTRHGSGTPNVPNVKPPVSNKLRNAYRSPLARLIQLPVVQHHFHIALNARFNARGSRSLIASHDIDGVADHVGEVLLTFRPLGIAQIPICVQAHPVEYRGIRYTIRVRIEPEQWSVAIHPAGVEMAGKIVTGTRGYATLQARSIINRWLEKHPAQKH
jgi:hypothetical protein